MTPNSASSAFLHQPDPENPGWHIWQLRDETRFNPQVMGKLIIRQEGERSVRLRMFPERRHSNLLDAVTEMLRETRRLVFLRELVMQEEHLIASYTGTIRRPSSGK